jgi:transmembrane sensor
MTHYQFYSVEDFVGDIRFRSWVRHTTPEEDAVWQEWIQENPEKRNVIEEARAIVLSIHPVQEENISDTEIQDEIQSILSKLQVDELPKVDNSGNHRQIYRWLSIAASVGVVLFIADWYLVRTDTNSLLAIEQSVKFAAFDIERVNRSDKHLLINLPDKSSVLLAQNSLIRYSNNFNGKTREVMLEGDAFFEVTKDETKPFYVHAGEIVAKVLGTSFEIKTNTENKQIEVTVRTGSVSVYADPLNDQRFLDDQPNIILTKNEQYIYRSDETEVQHIRLDSLSIEELSVPDTEMEFFDTKVTEVFSLLEKVYGVKFDYENAKIGDCSITASFTDEPFTLKLDLICRSIGLQYEIVNDRITIKGTGCATRF